MPSATRQLYRMKYTVELTCISMECHFQTNSPEVEPVAKQEQRIRPSKGARTTQHEARSQDCGAVKKLPNKANERK